jgi:hypothetical protein
MRNVCVLTIFGMLNTVITACESRQRDVAAVRGRVFEVINPSSPRADWTLVPLADVNVLVTWHAEYSVLVDSNFVCIRAIETNTAADGWFTVAEWKLPEGAKRAEAVSSASHAFLSEFEDVSVHSTPTSFATTAKHVHIMRRTNTMELASARDYRIRLKTECGAAARPDH